MVAAVKCECTWTLSRTLTPTPVPVPRLYTLTRGDHTVFVDLGRRLRILRRCMSLWVHVIRTYLVPRPGSHDVNVGECFCRYAHATQLLSGAPQPSPRRDGRMV